MVSSTRIREMIIMLGSYIHLVKIQFKPFIIRNNVAANGMVGDGWFPFK